MLFLKVMKKRNKRKERIWWESVWNISYYYAHCQMLLSLYALCSQRIITSLCSLSYNVITLCSTLYHVASASSHYFHILLSLLCSISYCRCYAPMLCIWSPVPCIHHIICSRSIIKKNDVKKKMGNVGSSWQHSY